VKSLEAQLGEQKQRAERAEAEKAASESAATSAAAEHKREMTALQSEIDALRAEIARSEAANAEKEKHIEVKVHFSRPVSLGPQSISYIGYYHIVKKCLLIELSAASGDLHNIFNTSSHIDLYNSMDYL